MPESKTQTVRKNMVFTERTVEMAEEIKRVRGYHSFSAVLQQGVVELYSKCFPSYSTPGKHMASTKDRLRMKAEEKEARQEAVLQEKMAVAKLLEGQVIEMPGIGLVCKYYTYSGPKRYEQQVSINFLTEDLLQSQYFPSREKVEYLQKNGKTDY